MAILTDEQGMLQEAAAGWTQTQAPITAFRHLRDKGAPYQHDAAIFADMAMMGWTGILVPEDHGGVGFDYMGLGLVLEALGHNLVASPLLSSALGVTSALLLGGDDAQQARWLPGLASGEHVGCLAIDEGARHNPDHIAMTATRDGNAWRLSGTKRPVVDGMAAHFAIVAAKVDDGIGLFIVNSDAQGVRRAPLQQIDCRDNAIWTFDDVCVSDDACVGQAGQADALLDAVLDRSRIGLAAEMVGAASHAFDDTIAYLKTRVQFGQLIGSFQALQHRAVAMYAELEMARSAVAAALSAIDQADDNLPQLASLAKAIAGDTFRLIASEMVQMHGGIGMTDEHDAGLYLKRSRVADALYGNSAFHRERFARLNKF